MLGLGAAACVISVAPPATSTIRSNGDDVSPLADLAITHVNVLDVRSGRRLMNRTVLIDGGSIKDVRPAAARSDANPIARRILDGRGGLLVPGFVDAHSHLSYLLGDSLSSGGGLITRLSSDPDSVRAYRQEYARQYIPFGVTAVRDVGSSEADLRLLVDWMRHPRADAPDVYPSGGALVSPEEGRIPYPGHRVVHDSADAVARVQAYHDLGLHNVKLYWRLREPEFVAALTEARRLGMHATGHVDFKVLGFERALDLGLRSVEHAYTLGVAALSREEYLAAWREDLPAWYGDRRRGRFYLGAMEYFNRLGPDDPRMARLISRLADTGSTVVPTLHVFAQRFGLAPFTSRRLGEFDDLSDLTPDQLEHARRGYRIMADYVRQLYEAGVPLAAGSDWIDPGQAVLSEMWLLHQAGIPMSEVLRIGTLGGAEALAMADRFGAVEPGMKADLVLLERDPIDDPAGLLGPRTVVKDGIVVMENGPPVGETDRGRVTPGTNQRPAEDHPTPHLAVLIAVDQLGSDVLERYGPYLPGGLGRLLREGARFENARVDHAVTVSHPGHVTLSTGLDPARHGIVDAAFYEGAAGERRFTDAVADSTERLLGLDGEAAADGASPRRILADGLWEWAAGSATRRVAIGTGRHSSLLYARTPGDVYWFDPRLPGYLTSTFYRNDLPSWVRAFNADSLPVFLADTAWTFSAPDSLRSLAQADSAAWESGGTHPTFPHRFHDEMPARYRSDPRAVVSWFSNTPMLDAATLGLARHAVRERSLGQRDATDLLVVVLSQIDNIGHWYGPWSLEQLDDLWRLDAELGAFFDFLDETVGAGRWVLALSADHSAPAAPEARRERGERAERVSGTQVEGALSAAEEAAAAAGADPGERAAAVAIAVERFPWVADAMTPDELLRDTALDAEPGTAPQDSFVRLYRHSYSATRVPRYPVFSFENGRSAVAREGVAVRLQPWAMLDLDVVVHGSPYLYDRRVPIIFYGTGVAAGCRETPATTKDVAPTLAALAGFGVPEGLDGHPLPVGNPERRRPGRSGRPCR